MKRRGKTTIVKLRDRVNSRDFLFVLKIFSVCADPGIFVRCGGGGGGAVGVEGQVHLTENESDNVF